MLTLVCVLSSLVLCLLGGLMAAVALKDRTPLWRVWAVLATSLFTLGVGQVCVATVLNVALSAKHY